MIYVKLCKVKKGREVMKKKLLFLMLVITSVLLVQAKPAKALENDEHYIQPNFYGNGKEIVISEREDGIAGAHIECDGKEYDVPSETTIYGGVWAPNETAEDMSVESTKITMNSGTVKNIYGAGMGPKTSVTGTATIVINGGTVKSFVYGGGCLESNGSSASVGKVNITFNGGKVTDAIIGTGPVGYVDEVNITVNSGAPTVATALKKGSVGTGKIVVTGGGATTIYNGYYYPNSADPFTSNNIKSLELDIWGGNNVNVYTTAVRNEENAVIPAKKITTVKYNKKVNIVEGAYSETSNFGKIFDEDTLSVIPYITLKVVMGNATEELVALNDKLLNEDEVKEVISSFLEDYDLTLDDVSLYTDRDFSEKYSYSAEVTDDVTIYLKEIPKYTFKLVYGDGDVEVKRTFKENQKIPAEELKAIFKEFLDKTGLTDDVYDRMEFYTDKDMTEKIETDEIGPITENLTLYVNIPQLREEELIDAPDTADINLITLIGTILIGSLGLAYTIKKRRFN